MANLGRMAQLSGLDAALWYLDSPTQPLEVAAIIEIADYPNGKIGAEGFISLLRDRLPRLSLLTKMVVDSPIPLAFPYWVEDPNFHLKDHVREVKITSDTSQHAREEALGSAKAQLTIPLDKSGAPWEMIYLSTQFEFDILVVRVHHALLDGGLGVETLTTMMDLEPAERPRRGRGSSPEGEQAPHGEKVTPKVAFLQALMDAPKEALSRLRHAADFQDALSEVSEAVREGDFTRIVQAFNFGARRFSVTGALTPSRDVLMWDIPLAEIAACARSYRATINEVLLAATGYAHAHYLVEMGDENARDSPLALMPISTRSSKGARETRNQMSAQLVSLPTLLEGPGAQIEAAKVASAHAKTMHSLAGPKLLEAFAGSLTSSPLRSLARFVSTKKAFDRLDPMFNLVVSNLSGSPVELFLGTSAVKAIYPFGPLVDGAPFNLTVASYLDRMCFGFTVCPDLVKNPEIFKDGFIKAIALFGSASQEDDTGSI